MGSMSWRTDQGQCGQVTVSGVHTGPAATARNSSDAEKLRTVPDNKKTGMLHNGLWHFVARQWCDPLKDHFKGDVHANAILLSLPSLPNITKTGRSLHISLVHLIQLGILRVSMISQVQCTASGKFLSPEQMTEQLCLWIPTDTVRWSQNLNSHDSRLQRNQPFLFNPDSSFEA